jgi:hypothetical protein
VRAAGAAASLNAQKLRRTSSQNNPHAEHHTKKDTRTSSQNTPHVHPHTRNHARITKRPTCTSSHENPCAHHRNSRTPPPTPPCPQTHRLLLRQGVLRAAGGACKAGQAGRGGHRACGAGKPLPSPVQSSPVFSPCRLASRAAPAPALHQLSLLHP